MTLEDMDLSEMLEQAAAAGACEGELSRLREFGSVSEILRRASTWNLGFWLYWYASKVVRGRWEAAEPELLKMPGWAYWYARDALRARWPEAEPIILSGPLGRYYRHDFGL